MRFSNMTDEIVIQKQFRKRRTMFFAGLGFSAAVAICAFAIGAQGEPKAGSNQTASTDARAVSETTSTATKGNPKMADKITKTDADWQKQLTSEQYHVLREK